MFIYIKLNWIHEISVWIRNEVRGMILESCSAVATEFLSYSVSKGKIFIFGFLNIFSDAIPIFESWFDCDHSPVFSEFPISISLADSCNKFFCENRMNITVKFDMSVQIDFEFFKSLVILLDSSKIFFLQRWILPLKNYRFLQLVTKLCSSALKW